ncbi:Urea ABC transporter, ATPase protein UrtE [Citrobacter freundii]|uniref:Urea ABC transporter, ATPase protein UrtE n=1 Tax=Citrobacter freundii TaxID=546 RepID=A0A7G2IWA7_CITFR|nr:Urea ABC transporter, ATPase protein UrtE [Citrobacter freundii]
MLQVKELNQYYGGSHILRGVNFEARIGEVTCLLGRNGVGKTTLLKCLMGLIPARSGSVLWQEKNVTHWKPHQRVRAGVAYVPQGRDIFPRFDGRRESAARPFPFFSTGGTTCAG